MRYTVTMEIALPREEVLALFEDAASRPGWQEGLEKVELLEGEEGRPGARSRLVFRFGKREMEMMETITRREPPELVAATYETRGVFNTLCNRFRALGPNRTRWESEVEFRFSGIMKVPAFFMRGSFVRQSRKYMAAFKALAEEGQGVKEAGAG